MKLDIERPGILRSLTLKAPGLFLIGLLHTRSRLLNRLLRGIGYYVGYRLRQLGDTVK